MSHPTPAQTLDRRVALLTRGSAALSAAIGLIVLVGWYTGTPALMRVHPSFVAMQFNTALAFVMMGLAVWTSVRELLRAALGCCAIVAILTTTAGIQYFGVTGLSLDGLMWYVGVDESLRWLTTVKTSSPGRMAPNTVVCFLLTTTAVGSLAALPRSRHAAVSGSLAGVAVVGIALLALLGYIGGAPSAYGWGGLTRMALLTAVAMLAIGLGVTTLAILRSREQGEFITRRLPGLVAVGGTVVTVGLWLAAADHDHAQRERAIAMAATRIRDNLANQTRPRLLALSRMRERWEFNGGASRRRWENDARLNLAHFPAYRAIAWADPDFQPVWIVAQPNESMADLESGGLQSRLGHWDPVADTVTLEDRRDPATGELSLLAMLPLRAGERLEGYLIGLISVPHVLASALGDSTVHGYAVRVRNDDSLSLQSGPRAAPGSEWSGGAPFEQDGLRWTIDVSPSAAVLAEMRSRVPATAALLGALVTGLLVWALRMLQVARQRELEWVDAIERAKDADIARERAAEQAHLNQQLLEQIAERERAQRDRDSIQQQLSQSQKMEAIGQLAGGMAHDFNNLLTVITSYCELLIEDLAADDPRRADVEEVLRAAGSAARLTRQLLAFSRQQILQPQALDLNQAVTEIEKMLRRLLPADITLSTSLDPAIGTIVADRGQLEQVIVNLVVNARDAMPDGGQLTIATANADVDDVYVSRHPFAVPEPGRYVLLSVADTGHGMDEATQARIFEPFFTTKEKGRGTGLGLSTVYGIVKQSGGYVWLYSEVGRGTTFKIYLPRVEAGTGARLSAPERRQVAGGNETILLVEDDAAVRTIAQRILERHGYRVIVAHNGAEALRVSEEWAQPLDLVVTDLVMPQMGGQEMVRVLRAKRPTVKVLMMSGYTSDQSFRQRVLEEGIPFLEKPFTPGSMLEKVRVVLDTCAPVESGTPGRS